MTDTVDYKAMNGADMLHAMGLDATKWADAFCQINPGVEHDIMVGWFANAIMFTLDTERGTIINGEHAQYLIDRADNHD